MRFSRWMLLQVFVLLAGMVSCGDKAPEVKEKVLLRFNLQEGKTYLYEMDAKVENEVQEKKMLSNMEFDYSIEVLSDSNGIKTIRNTYDRVRMNMDMPNVKAEIDTEVPLDTSAITDPIKMMQTVFYAIRGKSFLMKVDPNGKILEVSGLDLMLDSVVAGLNVEEERKPYFKAGFKAQFNEENLKQSFAQAFNIFPNREVGVGDSWEKEMLINNGMMKIKTRYTVSEIEGNVVKLDAESSFDMMGSTGKQVGKLQVNTNSGLVTDAEYTLSFEKPLKMVTTTVITGKIK